VKILFQIRSDRISGSGGGGSTAEPEAVGEERGEGCPAKDIARWRESGFREVAANKAES